MNRTTFKTRLAREKLVLPPLSRVTDYPFRCILAGFNPFTICTEMVNATALLKNNKKSLAMIQQEPGSHLKGVQLIGNNPEEMAEAALIIETKGFDYIDINMGCTVRKVVTKGQGVALMGQESHAAAIVEAVQSAITLPVTVKIRSGISEERKNAVSFSKKMEHAGAFAITVHARTGEKKFGDTLDYNIIKHITDAVSIPVIANGGVTDENLWDIIHTTGASAVMPGRHLIGNPWLIERIQQTIAHKPYQYPSLSEIKHIVQSHLMIQCMFYGCSIGIQRFRSILPRYFKHCQHLNHLKNDAKKITRPSDVINILERIHDDGYFFIYP